MIEFLTTFGPWGLVLLAMAWLIKAMVSDKLAAMLKLIGRVEALEVKQARIETAMNINGCLDGIPVCQRRLP